MDWCIKTYNKLIKAAENAKIIGIHSPSFSIKILGTIAIIESINDQIDILLAQINDLVKGDQLSDNFKHNINLLESIPGVGFLTAVTLMVEIGDFNGFIKPKQLVAFFGLDPSVNESGKFKSDKEKMSKRDTRFGRRALYTVALASIRTKRNGQAMNKVLLDYYQDNLKGKKKKVALVAIMYKIVNYLFAVLRDQRPYEQRIPKLHQQMYLRDKLVA